MIFKYDPMVIIVKDKKIKILSNLYFLCIYLKNAVTINPANPIRKNSFPNGQCIIVNVYPINSKIDESKKAMVYPNLFSELITNSNKPKHLRTNPPGLFV